MKQYHLKLNQKNNTFLTTTKNILCVGSFLCLSTSCNTNHSKLGVTSESSPLIGRVDTNITNEFMQSDPEATQTSIEETPTKSIKETPIKSITKLPIRYRQDKASNSVFDTIKAETTTGCGMIASNSSAIVAGFCGKIVGGPVAMSATRGIMNWALPQTTTILSSFAKYTTIQHATGLAYGIGTTYGPAVLGTLSWFTGLSVVAGIRACANYREDRKSLSIIKQNYNKDTAKNEIESNEIRAKKIVDEDEFIRITSNTTKKDAVDESLPDKVYKKDVPKTENNDTNVPETKNNGTNVLETEDNGSSSIR